MAKDPRPPRGGRRPSGRPIPGDPSKKAEVELPRIRRYIRDECSAGSVVTSMVISHIFDLLLDEAALAIATLLKEGLLVRNEEFGNIPTRPPNSKLPPERIERPEDTE